MTVKLAKVIIKDKTKNQVNVIYPYRTKSGVWCFDDPEVELDAEPFVGAINTMIDMHADGKKQLTVYISKEHISGSTLSLDRVKKGGGDYKLKGTDIVGWLCPATLKYFEKYPKEIHVKIEPFKK